MKLQKVELVISVILVILGLSYFILKGLNLLHINTPITAMQLGNVTTPIIGICSIYLLVVNAKRNSANHKNQE